MGGDLVFYLCFCYNAHRIFDFMSVCFKLAHVAETAPPGVTPFGGSQNSVKRQGCTWVHLNGISNAKEEDVSGQRSPSAHVRWGERTGKSRAVVTWEPQDVVWGEPGGGLSLRRCLEISRWIWLSPWSLWLFFNSTCARDHHHRHLRRHCRCYWLCGVFV